MNIFNFSVRQCIIAVYIANTVYIYIEAIEKLCCVRVGMTKGDS